MEVPPPEPEPIQIEMDLFMFPTPVQESKDQRPVLPYMVLIVEAQSGVVVGTEFLTADPSLKEMWSSGLLLQLLQPLAETAGFELGWAYSMPALEEAKQSLSEAFER